MSAVVVGTFDVGPIIEEDFFGPELEAGFKVGGENVLLDFTVNENVSDLNPTSGQGNFQDSDGIITLTGATSGGTINYSRGIEIVIANKERFEIRSPERSPTEDSPILADGIVFDTEGTAFFTDPDNLALSLSELQANPFNSQTTSTAATEFVSSKTDATETGIEFGPVPKDNLVSEPVPFEAEGTMGLVALGGFFWYRKCKRAKNN